MSGSPTIAPLHDSSHRPLLKSGLVAGGRPQRSTGANSNSTSSAITSATSSPSPRIELRSEADVEGIARAGALVASVLEVARNACKAGVTTSEINQAAHHAILAGGGEALFVGYRGTSESRPAFPAATCISVNEELVHGVPSARVVQDGDLVSIDVGVRLDGWCADSAITVCVGEVLAERHALVACAEAMLQHAIAAAVPGRRWSGIARELEAIAEQANFAIAVDFVGHGIGRKLHEPPQVPCSAYRSFREHGDFTLRPGMVLAIEPMLVLEAPQRLVAGESAGDLCSPTCTLAADGWTVVLNSGRPSCHVEHTVVITRDGARVLTAASKYSSHADYRRAG